MKNSIRIIAVICAMCAILCFAGCASVDVSAAGSEIDTQNTMNAADRMQTNQPTPTDIDYSLERYNLIRQ